MWNLGQEFWFTTSDQSMPLPYADTFGTDFDVGQLSNSSGRSSCCTHPYKVPSMFHLNTAVMFDKTREWNSSSIHFLHLQNKRYAKWHVVTPRPQPSCRQSWYPFNGSASDHTDSGSSETYPSRGEHICACRIWRPMKWLWQMCLPSILLAVNEEVSPSGGVLGRCEMARWKWVQLVHSGLFH